MVVATARAAAVSPGRARRRQGDRKGGGQPPTPRPSSPAAWTTTFRSDPVRYVETRTDGPRAAPVLVSQASGAIPGTAGRPSPNRLDFVNGTEARRRSPLSL